MKFLLFNILAVGAFFVLFSDDEPVSEKAQSLTKAVAEQVKEFKKDPPAEPAQVDKKIASIEKKAEVPEPPAQRKVPLDQSATQQQASIWVDQPKVNKPDFSKIKNSPSQSSADKGNLLKRPTFTESKPALGSNTTVETTGKKAAVEPDVALEEGTTLMSSKERRRQLHNLAQGMELFFLDRTQR